MIKKYLGFFLILLGLAVIFYSLYSSYNIFFNKSQVPEVFKYVKQTETSSQQPSSIEGQIEKMMGEKIKEAVPFEAIYKSLNLFAWSIFAWLLISGGGVISGIGAKLLNDKHEVHS